jgi:hypothetical protein
MVILIGLVTMSVLVWLLAWSLTGESDSEHRRMASMKERSVSGAEPSSAVPLRRAA